MSLSSKEAVVIVGSGGREAALVSAYTKSPHVGKVIAIPGNDSMKYMAKHLGKDVETHQHLTLTSVQEIVDIASEAYAALVDVAQDDALAAGTVDAVEAKGLRAVGPTKKSAKLEWDKADARDFMNYHFIPHPRFKVCNTEEEGISFIKERLRAQQEGYESPMQWVIKANGLAAGKGAIVTDTPQEAISAIKMMKSFGKAGEKFLIEQRLFGEEVSRFDISDGKTSTFIGAAQDHKREYDGDIGENTGGMGCSTPPLILTPEINQKVQQMIIDPTFAAMQKEYRPYTGVLYTGLMIDHTGTPKVIEYNARLGDPEAQAILPGIENDYFELMQALVEGKLSDIQMNVNNKARVVVAGTSKGYPRSSEVATVKGKEILGIDVACKMEGVTFYGAGMKVSEGRYYANGGRLFYLVGEGNDVNQARSRAYAAMAQVSIPGDNSTNLLHYRKDIGHRDQARLAKEK